MTDRVGQSVATDLSDAEHAALYFERQYDRLWEELKDTRFGYLFARGVLSGDHARARRITAELKEQRDA